MARQRIKSPMKDKIAHPHRPVARSRLIDGIGLPLIIYLVTALVMAMVTALAINTAQAGTPDYDALDEILVRNVRNGFVDYNGIAAEPNFDEFINAIGSTQPVDLTSDEARLAFYINAYNTLAIKGILDGRSPSSWWGRRTFFKKQKYNILGDMMSLETLEHERLHALGEPRMHFAIVCASMSCPRLSSRAYRPENLNTQLHEAAKRFINDPTRNRFDPERRIAFLSKVFEWYADDFIAAGGSLQRYLARFVSDAAVQDLLRQDGFDIRFVEYDWNLNGRFSGKD
jgi:hypothetical protein